MEMQNAFHYLVVIIKVNPAAQLLCSFNLLRKLTKVTNATNDYIVSYYQFVLFTVSDDDGDIVIHYYPNTLTLRK